MADHRSYGNTNFSVKAARKLNKKEFIDQHKHLAKDEHIGEGNDLGQIWEDLQEKPEGKAEKAEKK